jgi:hypothetical protein
MKRQIQYKERHWINTYSFGTSDVYTTSYLDLYVDSDNEGQLCFTIYDKQDDFDFLIENVPLLIDNNPILPYV